MVTIFSDQLDFILFFYGLAFLLLGAVCFAVDRSSQQGIPWTVLGTFAYLHGASEWADLSALVIGDGPAFALSRTALMTLSFVVLLEFGREAALRSQLPVPGRWIYLLLLLLLLLVVWGWNFAGITAANTFARYALALPGAALGCAMLAINARNAPGPEKRWLLTGAVALALYGLAAGAVVPSIPNWAGDVINYDLFARYTGMPIQFVRGLLACALAFSIWAYWGQRLIVDVDSARYSKFQRRQFVATISALAVILALGWFLTQVLGTIYKNNVEQEAIGELNLITSRLAGETAATEGMVRALAGSTEVSQLASNDPKADRDRVDDLLSLETEASGAVEGFLLDRLGTAFAASVRASVSPTAWVGQNFSGAPYFKSAMANGPGYHFIISPSDRQTNYYVSYPIRDKAGEAIGVAVLKKSLTRFATDMDQLDRSFAMVDRDGIVVLTNRPEMAFRTLWPLTPERRIDRERYYGPLKTVPPLKKEFFGASWTVFDGTQDYVQRRNLARGDWALITWKSRRAFSPAGFSVSS